MARDALSSGDPVLAENYLQHAEHYNRIIMSFREQQGANTGDGANGHGQRHQVNGTAQDDGDSSEEPRDTQGGEQLASDSERRSGANGNQGQGRQPRGFESQPHIDDHGPVDRDTAQRRRQGNAAQDGDDRGDAAAGKSEGRPQQGRQGGPRRRDRLAENEQPEFLRRSVRRPRRGGQGNEGDEPGDRNSSDEASEDARDETSV